MSNIRRRRGTNHARQAATEDEVDSTATGTGTSSGVIVRREGSESMACTAIKKLAISGIRAFSPTREEVIEFYHPLTMIVGFNGCGKTTIIECLKYACTGTPPPGGDKGKSFVHDPKIAGMPEVKASIKLRFSNRAGKDMVVIRSLQVTQSKKAMTFKTLDGVIKTNNEDTGEKTSMSHKCGELDKQIPSYMGVSKAILENVIFCHQEDSSWPLADSKTLKSKFDDIFESSRYSKALEALRKERTAKLTQVKEFQVDLARLDTLEQQATALKREMDEHEKIYESLQASEAEHTKKLKVLRESIAHKQAIQEKIQGRKKEWTEMKQELQRKQHRLSDKRQDLGANLSEKSEKELRKELGVLKKEGKDLVEKISDLRGKMQKATDEQETIRDQINEINMKIGELTGEAKRQDADREKRYVLATSFAAEYDLAEPKDATSSAVEEVVSKLQEAVSASDHAVQQDEKDFDSECGKLNSELRTLEGEARKAEMIIEKADDDRNRLEKELQELNVQAQQHSRNRANQRQIEEAKEKYEDSRENHAKLKTRLDELNAQSTHRKLEVEVKGINEKLAEHRHMAELLESRDDQEKELALRERQIAEDDEDLDHKLKDFIPRLSHFVDLPLSTAPQQISDVKVAVDQEAENIREAMKKAEDTHRADERNIVQHESKIQGHKDRLSQLEKRLKLKDKVSSSLATEAITLAALAAERQLEDDVSASNPHEMLRVANDLISDYQMELSTAKAEQDYAKHLRRKAEKALRKHGQAVCACCDRPMNSEEYGKFNERMKQVEQGEDNHVVQEQLNELEALRDRVNQRIPEIDAFRKDHGEIKTLKGTVSELEKELSDLKEYQQASEKKLKNTRDQLSRVEEVTRSLESFLHEAQELERRKNESDENRARFASQLDTLGSGSSVPKSLAQLKCDLRDLESEKETKEAAMAKFTNERLRLFEREQLLSTEMRGYQDQISTLEAKVKKLNEVEEKKESVRKEIKSIEKARVAASRELAPQKQRITEKQAHIQRLTSGWKEKQKTLRERHSRLERDTRELSSLHDSLMSSEGSGDPRTKLATIEAEKGSLDKRLKRMVEKAEDYQNRMRREEEFTEGKDAMITIVEGNLVCLELENEIRNDQAKLQEVGEEVSAIPEAETVVEDLEKLQKKVTQVSQAKAVNEGRMTSEKGYIQEKKRTLQESQFRNITEKTRNKRNEVDTTKMVADDLEKYWGALDNALLKYHENKIQDINRIIRELWQRTYTGEDIESIEIVSGQEGSGSTRASRSYNYRVVMRKGDTQLDMRGRCSAGQRVLACLVIRLALAETFCISCGILTLDEPTTNLDECNKQGLATALADIISSRSKQRNFQLLVITHDTDFVTHMRDAFNSLGADRNFPIPEFYFRIARTQTEGGNHVSTILRTDWDDL